MSAGCLTLPAVRRVLVATSPLDAEGCGVVERRLLTRCGRPDLRALGDMSPDRDGRLPTDVVTAISARASTGWVTRTARTLTHRVDPEAAARRETRARKNRSVRLEPGDDGMAWLMLHLPQAAAEAGYEHVDALARAVPDSPDDARDLDAKRADMAVALLTGATDEAGPVGTDGQAAGPVQVNIHVLLDQSSPADATEGTIVGHAGRLGPVTAEAVRDLFELAAATGGSVVTARATDIPCPGPEVHAAEGPGPYQPSEPLKRLLRARHRTCTFPGCGRNSRHCDLDHRLRWPEGPTCFCNLHPLCEHHHQLKHAAPGWRFTHHGDGRVTWTTPTGRRIRVEPEAPDDPSP